MNKLAILSLTLFSLPIYAAPKSDLWVYWQQSNENSHAEISHQAWQEILTRHISIDGQHHLFSYQSVTTEEQHKLDRYLTSLSEVDPRKFSKAEQYAYWVNLYNAATIDLILEEYPIDSITKLGGFFSFGPWDEDVITINGKALSLNDIEHRILRPIWQDPRTHYAVNCASLSCPNLQTKAFTAKNSEQLLNNAAKAFINSNKGVEIEGNTLVLSSIYDWFSEDFLIDGGVQKHLNKYRTNLEDVSGSFTYQYDWSLNDKP
ncbi:DUF547 domain-containing protein [Vibrio kasasachensis]|uniref:DUF547 domain-containing protein n=1 Tax=Vibrio kasasachensis TaxID=2910248 RepID=UPI003D1159E8